MPSGILLLNKPEGYTSHDAVNLVRRAFGTRQVGHTGTLDPMATGLLIVLVGRAVKASEELTAHSKKYRAKIRFGVETDTGDSTGNIISASGEHPDPEELAKAVSSFIGETEQLPPMYSAVKIGGKKLYELARQGKSVDRTPRKITVFSLGCEPTGDPFEYALDVECSSGTYIRTLCEDIGKKTGCGAVMSALQRTAVGAFGIESAVSPKDLEAAAAEGKAADLLVPLEYAFTDLPACRLNAFHEKLIRNGCAVDKEKLKYALGVSSDGESDKFRLYSADGLFFGLGETVQSETGPAIKARKLFVL